MARLNLSSELRLFLICTLLVVFEIFMFWVGNFGAEFTDTYSEMIYFGFFVQIGLFLQFLFKGGKLPTAIQITTVVTVILCIMALPLVSFFAQSLSLGFALAVTADTSFKGIVFCYQFVPAK